MLVKYLYLYKDGVIYVPTQKMIALDLCKDSGNKYHTLYYKDDMIDFAKRLIDKESLENELMR